jgi:hypothetical protein
MISTPSSRPAAMSSHSRIVIGLTSFRPTHPHGKLLIFMSRSP